MTISIFLMGAQLKCARALSKIYKPSRTLEGAIPLQHYSHWPTVCAACVLSNTHTHTQRELALLLHCLWVLLPLPFSIYCLLSVPFMLLLLFWSVVVLVVGLFYKRVSACFTHVSSGSLTRSALSSLPFAFVLFVLAATASSPAPAQSHIFLLSAEGGWVRGMRGRGSHRPRYFLLALFVVGHNTKKKESELLIAFSICC